MYVCVLYELATKVSTKVYLLQLIHQATGTSHDTRNQDPTMQAKLQQAETNHVICQFRNKNLD